MFTQTSVYTQPETAQNTIVRRSLTATLYTRIVRGRDSVPALAGRAQYTTHKPNRAVVNSTQLNFIVTYLQLNSGTAELLNIYNSIGLNMCDNKYSKTYNGTIKIQ